MKALQVIHTIRATDGALAAAEACSKIAGLLNRWAGALVAHAADTYECGARYAELAVEQFEALAATQADTEENANRLAHGLEAALFWQALNLASLCGEAGGGGEAAVGAAGAVRQAVERLRGLYASRQAPAASGDANIWFVEGVLRLQVDCGSSSNNNHLGASADMASDAAAAAAACGAAESSWKRTGSRDASFWGPGSPLGGVVERVRSAALQQPAVADSGAGTLCDLSVVGAVRKGT